MSYVLLSVSNAMLLTDSLLVDRWWCRVLPWCHASIVQKLRKLSELGGIVKVGACVGNILGGMFWGRERDAPLIVVCHHAMVAIDR